MIVRALQSCYICGTYRKGPEFNDRDEVVARGEEFEVPDNLEVNPEVLEVVTPPTGGPPNIIDPKGETKPAKALKVSGGK